MNQSDPNINTTAAADGSLVTPPNTSGIPDITTSSAGTGSASPVASDFDVTSVPKKKFGTGKIVATILGLLVLVGGIGGGVYLTQQQQDIREKAMANADCRDVRIAGASGPCGPQQVACRQEYARDCEMDDGGSPCPPGEVLTKTTRQVTDCRTLENCINGDASQGYAPGGTPGAPCSCKKGRVDPETGDQEVNCTKTTCTALRTVYVCEPSTPTITASCKDTKAYDSSWVLLTDANLKTKKKGDIINFCVEGTKNGGNFDKARFVINNEAFDETTTTRPSSTDFCQSYEIKSTDTKIDVSAEIHHTTLGWK